MKLHIIIMNLSLNKSLQAYRSNIGMIFQSFNLIERLDVLTNIILGKFGVIPLWQAIMFRILEIEDAFRRKGLLG